jgi:hypothetical protein
MKSALLVLRIIPGVVLMGHGLQKLVPPATRRRCCARPVIAARGRASRASASVREWWPPSWRALPSSSAAARSRRAPHAGRQRSCRRRDGNRDSQGACRERGWAAEGGFEFPLVLLTGDFVIPALGPGISLGRLMACDRQPGRYRLDDQPRCALGDRAGRRPRRRPRGGHGILGVEAHPDPRGPRDGALMPYASVGVRELWVGRVERRRCHGIRRGKVAREARGRLPSGCCPGLLALVRADGRGHSSDSSRRRRRPRDPRRRCAARIDSA